MGTSGPSFNERLDRLNPVERELLILLGRGHTAKSIATLKGLSVPAVNERFRAARRKTGFGSTREVARLLIAQEIRHDLIDLASEPFPPSDLPRHDAPPFRRASPLRRWRYPMLATGLLAVALLAQQTSTPPAPAPTSATEGQTIVAELLARQPQAPDLTVLNAEAAGAPDPVWSPETEAMLSQRYNAVRGFSEGVDSFGVTCSATLCEVAGVGRPGLSADQINDLITGLQNPVNELRASVLEHVLHSFGTTADQPTSFVFVTYWRRRG